MTKALETPIATTKERWAEAEINRMRGTCCSQCMRRPPSRIAIAERLRSRANSKQNFGNSAPQGTSRGSGATRATCSKHANSGVRVVYGGF